MRQNTLQKNGFLCFIILLPFFTHCTENLDKFYSTPFLKNQIAVHNSLKDYGFTEITFKTPDQLTLHGLFLSRPHATCNVIVCAGWFPGKKEGMAVFFAMLPDYCNILLFDARGRGENKSSFFANIWRYGTDEYKDIYGALAWINKYNKLPIVIGGICSGVFNAAHAIIYLAQKNMLTHYHVKGLVFDSGWGSVLTMSQSSAIANIKKYTARAIAFFYGTKKNVEQCMLYKLFFSSLYYGFNIAHFLFARPVIALYEQKTNLFDKIHHIPLPIFFIHSYNDTHADIKNAIKLSQSAQNCQCWWIKKSSHAKHHLVHKETYKEKLKNFIDTVIQ